MKLVEPNDSLAEEYYKNAEETLRVTNLIKNSGSNMWLATQKYYTEYLYYLKNRPVDFNPKQLSEILLKIRKILDTITKEQIKTIRDVIKHG